MATKRKLNAVIIDDERSGIEGLKSLTSAHKDLLHITGSADTLAKGIALIREADPDLVFLDVQFPEGTGFQLLEQFPQRSFQVIFVTAYEEHAIKAIKQHAADYLLKPVKIPELREAVYYVSTQVSYAANKYEELKMDHDSISGFSNKISIASANGYDYIAIDSIMYLEADGMYTTIYLHQNESTVVSKGLSRFEEVLKQKGFLRINRSFLVNINFIERISRNDGCSVQMVDGKLISIPFKHRKVIVDRINSLSHIVA